MKKAYTIIAGIILGLIILLGYRTSAEASSYKAQLVLDSYEVPDEYNIGEDTSIKVYFKNTDSSYYIRNVLINCSSNGNTVIPVEGKSNQFYLEAIKPGETVSVDIPIVMTHSESGYASMNFGVEYICDDARWSASSYIVFPVRENESPIVIKNINVPADVTVDGNILVSTYFMNASDKDLFNTRFVVSGDISGGESTTSLGTVAVKRNSYAENYISFGTPGKKVFSLSIRYEDSNGNAYEELLGEYSVDVKEVNSQINKVDVTGNNGEDINTPQPNEPMDISLILLVISGIIVLIIIVVIAVNLIRKRK